MDELIKAASDVVKANASPAITENLNDWLGMVNDIIATDFQSGDWWLMAVHEASVQLVLAKKLNVNYVLSQCCARSVLFKIGVSNDDFSIDDVALDSAQDELASLKHTQFRSGSRELDFQLLYRLEKRLLSAGIIGLWHYGQSLFIETDNNSASYFVSHSDVAGTIPLPFSLDRPKGCRRFDYISKYGHAEMKLISRAQYQRAMKKRHAA